MTIPFIELTLRKSDDRGWTKHRPIKFLSCLAAATIEYVKLRNADINALDEMTEAQLEEIGMRRTAHRARWLDCSETSLTQNFDYRSLPREPYASRGRW